MDMVEGTEKPSLEGETKNLLSLTHSPLDVGALSAEVTQPSTGATALFVGTTRDNFQGRRVIRLEYEAYESMALKELGSVCRELRTRWPDLERIGIQHRLGEVPVTQPSVVIAISSPHRKDALQAVEHCIEVLKARVPIWKKEVYSDGEADWKANKECSWTPQGS